MSGLLNIVGFVDGLGGMEIFIILIVVLLLFGGERMPGLAKGIGKAMREFKKATSDVENEIKRAIDEAPDSDAKPPVTAPTARVEPNPVTPTKPADVAPPAPTTSDPEEPKTTDEKPPQPPTQPMPRLPDVDP